MHDRCTLWIIRYSDGVIATVHGKFSEAEERAEEYISNAFEVTYEII